MAILEVCFPNCVFDYYPIVTVDNKRCPVSTPTQSDVQAFIYDLENDQFAYNDSDWWQEVKRLLVEDSAGGSLWYNFKLREILDVKLNVIDPNPIRYVIRKAILHNSWTAVGNDNCADFWELVLSHDYYDDGWL